MNLRKFYMNSFMHDMTAFGTIYHFIVLIAVLFSLGQQELVYKLAAGQVIMYLIGIPLKLFMFKDRPNRIKHEKNFLGKSSIKNIIERIEASSFPSVHTLRIFFVSTVLIIYFKNTMLSAILAVISLLVAYSRVYLKKHYYVDIIVGVIIGIALGYGVVNYV